MLLACLAAGALMVARLNQGISVVVCVSVVRTISLISLHKVRATWRPYVAYLVGVLGILLARYADKLLQNPARIHKEGCTPVSGARGEIPAFKRRRRSSGSVIISSDMAHSQPNSSKSHRRTSLPCLQRDQVSTLGVILSQPELAYSLFCSVWGSFAVTRPELRSLRRTVEKPRSHV